MGCFLIMLFLQTFHQTISALESMALMKNIFTGKAVYSPSCHTGIINGSDPGVKKAVSGCTCRLETFGILGDPCLMSREKTMKKETEKKTPNRADHKGYFDYTARDLTPVWDKGRGSDLRWIRLFLAQRDSIVI